MRLWGSPVARKKRCRTVRGDNPCGRPRNTVSTSGSRTSTPLRTSLSTNDSAFSWLGNSHAEPFNAWCELNLPSQQIGKGQPRTTELLVEPHTEIVQRYSGPQTSPQTTQLVRALPPEAEGVE